MACAIEAVDAPFQGYFQTVKYTITHQTGSGPRTDVVGPMPVKSEIIRPVTGAVLGVGANRILGMAWAGERAVAAVEVSVDGGATWQSTELHGPTARFSWTPWEFLWKVTSAGEYSLRARAISESGEVQPMAHDMDRGGYLINFSRPIDVTIDPARTSQDHLGDARALQAEMADVARQRSSQRLDADLDLVSGAGI